MSKYTIQFEAENLAVESVDLIKSAFVAAEIYNVTIGWSPDQNVSVVDN